jgi:DNA-binding NarL/FixJ family response regulator
MPPAPPAISVVTLSPQPTLRAGLRSALAETYSLVGAAASLEDLPPLLTAQVWVLAACDVATAAQVAASQPEGATALWLDAAAPVEVRLLPWRAWGWLPLTATADELRAAVAALAAGLWVGPGPLTNEPDERASPSGEARIRLTERENQVLQALARGLANKQIGVSLGISEHTVKFHLSAIYSKLGAANRAEVVRLGIQAGLVLL